MGCGAAKPAKEPSADPKPEDKAKEPAAKATTSKSETTAATPATAPESTTKTDPPAESAPESAPKTDPPTESAPEVTATAPAEAPAPVNTTEDDVYDVAIVGGGWGGATIAHWISKAKSFEKVVAFESTNRMGGRLKSDDNDTAQGNTTTKDELGGMRLFPSQQPEVAELVAAAGCTLTEVPLTDKTNIFYFNGQHHVKGEYKMESGRSPSEMAEQCIAGYKEACGGDVPDPYASEELKNSNLRDFFKKYGATDDEIDCWFAYSGYNLYDDEIAASIFVKDGELYGPDLSNDQRYVAEGYQTVVTKLYELSGVKLHKLTKVISVKKQSDDTFILTTKDNGGGGEEAQWKAKKVIVSLPQDQLKELMAESDGLSDDRRAALESVKMMPLFKCFLEWDTPWWKERNFMCGKSTTDKDVRQIHYYDNEDILLYNSGPFADKWNEAFTADPAAGARQMYEILCEVHAREGDDTPPEPAWERVIYKYWPSGSHKWRVGWDVPQTIRKVAVEDSSNLYICGDAYSSFQGWVAGAIETAKICYDHMTK
eukprot:GFYU01014333.1.p1 GENE.GFYU01014333.1~~GFYU01014333.1.p1  ORF type:complete len:541 (-),score=166.83 GFYU01014333.1:46-1668(-)